MREFDGGDGWDEARLNLLGVNGMKGIPHEGISTLHFMLWKHILIQMTMWSLKRIPPNVQQIINRAVIRLDKRVSALQYEITCVYCQAEARSIQPNLRQAKRKIKGIGFVLDSGKIMYNQEFTALLQAASL